MNNLLVFEVFVDSIISHFLRLSNYFVMLHRRRRRNRIRKTKAAGIRKERLRIIEKSVIPDSAKN